GARFLHVVDLDGARVGKPRSLEHLERITRELRVPVQYGGGLRALPAARDALRAGAHRVIVGTAAYTDLDFLDDVVAGFGDRQVNLAGVIVGKALYEGRFTVAEGQEVLEAA